MNTPPGHSPSTDKGGAQAEPSNGGFDGRE